MSVATRFAKLASAGFPMAANLLAFLSGDRVSDRLHHLLNLLLIHFNAGILL